jgi:hypothetical protein
MSTLPFQYVWITWASAFLAPWLGLLLVLPRYRRIMVWASVLTTPFGLTEPLFVPRYWNPPSLFDLAHRTGFDIESLIFCFGIGGVGAVLYNTVARSTPQPVGAAERRQGRHRHHRAALLVPIVVFPLLLPTGWNPIYPAIAAMGLGAAAAGACRPDLARRTWVGGWLFAGYYVVFFLGLEGSAPGFVERVWNLPALSGVRVAGIPVEEILFAFGFGAYWSSVYEHLAWRRDAPAGSGDAPAPMS